MYLDLLKVNLQSVSKDEDTKVLRNRTPDKPREKRNLRKGNMQKELTLKPVKSQLPTHTSAAMDPQTCVFKSCTLILEHPLTAHDGDNKQVQTTATLKTSNHNRLN